MDIQNNLFIGQGWSFPPEFDKSVGEVKLIGEEGDIEQSLYLILTTRLGERVMRPDFGSSLQDQVFDSFDLTTGTLLETQIRLALQTYEARVSVEKVQVTQEDPYEGRILIEISYRVLSSNAQRNLVFPFYLQGGNSPY